MKKLLFVFAFAFIGGQAFSQMYIVQISSVSSNHPQNCSLGNDNAVMTTIDPQGNITYDCMPNGGTADHGAQHIKDLNQQFNTIIGQGYKLVASDATNDISTNGLPRGTWYFAIPWTSNGLEEVPTTLKSFIISPNPANTFVDISLNYSLKGESEVVFISEAGYISHKESIGNISKNEKYNIDISKIPAGKYLITIVNRKTYTTPQKIIVL